MRILGFSPVLRAKNRATHRRNAGAFLGILIAVLLGGVLTQTAAATSGFSFVPSTTEPYAVCGHPASGHEACLAIIIPAAFARTSTHSSLQPAAQPSFEGGGVGGGFGPSELESAYGLPSSSAGSGQTVAIVDAYDDPDAESDLAKYRSHYGLSACTTENGCFKKVNQTGGTSYPTPNPSWAVEISLDLDMVSAACPKCHVLLVEATTNSSANLDAAEDEAVELGATGISNSWGSKEVEGDSSRDTYFTHHDVPITFSAGDSGYEVEYPASSPDVIAVGGTNLKKASNTRGWEETAWSGTGSGCSEHESKPSWQHDTGCSHRTNNDVAAVAGTTTPVSVADSYEPPPGYEVEPGWALVAGTSVASPLVSGTVALAESAAKELPGAEAFYDQAEENGTGALDDVVSGSNGSCGNYLCEAGPGYDGPTGLGSPYGAPSAPAEPITAEPESLYETQATLSGTVNPRGHEAKYFFEYGTTTSYGSSTAEGSTGSGTSPVSVSTTVTGLTAQLTYHYRLVAKTGNHLSYGKDEVFILPQEISSRWAYHDAQTGDMWVYYPNKESPLWDWSWNGEWHDNKIGGEIASGTFPTTLDDPDTGWKWAYYVGKEKALWYWAWTGTEWAQKKLGGEVAPETSPTAVLGLRKPTLAVQYVYYVGKEDALWYWSWDGTTWRQTKLGGEVAAGTSPTAFHDPNTGDMWVYYVGKEDALWSWFWNGTTWTNTKIGGEIEPGTSLSAVRNPKTGDIWVYYVGKESAIWEASWAGEWRFNKLGGEVASGSSPSAMLDPGTGWQWIYYVGKENALWYWAWNGEWQKKKIGGEVESKTSPTVVLGQADPELAVQWVYYVGKENAMWYWAWTGTEWKQTKLGGEVA